MTRYRSIEQTTMEATGQADFEHGQAATVAPWQGKTVGFFGADLGSHAPSPGRVPAFLGLAERTGGVYVENAPSIADALRQTGLDFEVRKEEIAAHITNPVIDGDDVRTEDVKLAMPKWYANVAHPHDGREPFAIAPVGKYYNPVQTEEALAFGDTIVDGGRGSLVALGAYGDPVGSKVYAAFRLPEGILIGGQDPYDLYLTVINSFDRSGGLTALTAPIRLGCTNQTTATFRGAKPRFTIRHTKSARARVMEARRTLELTFAYADVFAAEAEKLLAKPMGKDGFIVYAREVFRTKAEEDQSKAGQTKQKQREDWLMGILASETNEFGRGTAYAGYQALVEYSDFYGPARGDATAARQMRIMAGQTERFKNRAFELAAAL